jgi:hypothetical protein
MGWTNDEPIQNGKIMAFTDDLRYENLWHFSVHHQ